MYTLFAFWAIVALFGYWMDQLWNTELYSVPELLIGALLLVIGPWTVIWAIFEALGFHLP